MGFEEVEVEGWTTVYITGKTGFSEVILNRLGDHWLLGTAAKDAALMFWLPDITQLRTFKKSVGAKLILKYRIRFFIDVEEQLLSDIIPNNEFSAAEKIMINEIMSWEQSHLRNQVLAG